MAVLAGAGWIGKKQSADHTGIRAGSEYRNGADRYAVAGPEAATYRKQMRSMQKKCRGRPHPCFTRKQLVKKRIERNYNRCSSAHHLQSMPAALFLYAALYKAKGNGRLKRVRIFPVLPCRRNCAFYHKLISIFKRTKYQCRQDAPTSNHNNGPGYTVTPDLFFYVH